MNLTKIVQLLSMLLLCPHSATWSMEHHNKPSKLTPNERLVKAVEENDVAAAQAAILAGALPSHRLALGNRPIIHAVAQQHNVEMLSVLVTGAPWSLINLHDSYGRTPLHYAAINGSYQAAQLLIENEAAINSRDLYYESTPLHYAAWHGDSRLIRYLLEHHADVNSVNAHDTTPLGLAIRFQRTENYEQLILFGARVMPEWRDVLSKKLRPLEIMIIYNEYDDAEDYIIKNPTHATARALAYAAGQGNKTFVRYLLRHGAPPFQAFDVVSSILKHPRLNAADRRVYSQIHTLLQASINRYRELVTNPAENSYMGLLPRDITRIACSFLSPH